MGGDWPPIAALLEALRADPYFALPPPKSTGRDHFNLRWVEARLQSTYAPADVQRSLLALTSATIAEAIAAHCAGASEIVVCGGGAHNGALLRELAPRSRGPRARDDRGVWRPGRRCRGAGVRVARSRIACRTAGQSAGGDRARGPRVLGAVYPA